MASFSHLFGDFHGAKCGIVHCRNARFRHLLQGESIKKAFITRYSVKLIHDACNTTPLLFFIPPIMKRTTPRDPAIFAKRIIGRQVKAADERSTMFSIHWRGAFWECAGKGFLISPEARAPYAPQSPHPTPQSSPAQACPWPAPSGGKWPIIGGVRIRDF